MNKPVIGLMIGDPCGIGPEVCVKAIGAGGAGDLVHVVLIGSAAAVEREIKERAMAGLRCRAISDVSEASFQPGTVEVLEASQLDLSEMRRGTVSPACGAAVFSWVKLADQLAESGAIQGWVMAPVSAEALRAAGVAKSIDDLQPAGTFMMRISGNLRVVGLSEHIPLRAVPDDITKERILGLIEAVDTKIREWGMHNARYGVAGLNPHATGSEEQDQIAPAVAQAVACGLDVAGPIPPDSVFRRCIEGHFDVVVSMYHDQGQIALKTAAFLGACTIYLGVPYVRLTVPHGTAIDIAGKGVARHESILAALQTAAHLASGKGFPTLTERTSEAPSVPSAPDGARQ